jgi:hypothetical protein
MTLKEIAGITSQLGYKWVAIDKFKNLFAYREEPTLNVEAGGWSQNYNKTMRIHKTKYTYEGDWKDSLTYVA